MPAATPIPRRPHDEPLAKRQRFQIVKVAAASLCVLLLLYAGFQGRQHARVQVKLNEITAVRDQLQRRLNDPQISSTGLPSSANAQVAPVANGLKVLLEQFDLENSPRQLSEPERLELRLSQATLANAERRFTEALALITDQDEVETRSGSKAQRPRLVRILQLRGDSFYGLREWQKALDRYREALTLKPNRSATMARIAECQRALGKTN